LNALKPSPLNRAKAVLLGVKRAVRPRTRWRELLDWLAPVGGGVRALGVLGALRYLVWYCFGWPGSNDYLLHPRQARYPLRLRPRSSDPAAFFQIFILDEYACLDGAAKVDLVIDAGANVGCSSAYFLSRFPDCRVIAVEPEAENCAQLRRNLAPYGDRAEVVQAGIWPRPARLVMAEEIYRDGRAWSRQVRECRAGEPGEMDGIDIASLLARSGAERISILKMDIEGTEALVFAGGHRAWIDRVDTLLIELHEDSVFGRGSEVFYPAIEGQDFSITQSGELTVCQRSRAVA